MGGRIGKSAGYFRDGILHVELVKFFCNAKVHDDKKSGAAGAFGRRFVLDTFLHPNCAGADLNCALDDFGDKFRAAKNVNDVDLFGDVFEAGVAFFTEDR